MKSISINGKEYKIPQTLHEVTLKQYCTIFKGIKLTADMEWRDIKYNEAKLVSRILGEDDDFTLSLPLSVYNDICAMCTFLYDMDKRHHTDTITLNGKKYTIPKPADMNLRQWIDVDITRQTEDEGMFVELYAILLCEVDDEGKTKPYDGNYKDRIGLLEEYPADDAMSMINDFFAEGESSQRVSDAYSKVEEAINRFVRPTADS